MWFGLNQGLSLRPAPGSTETFGAVGCQIDSGRLSARNLADQLTGDAAQRETEVVVAESEN